MPMAIWPRTWQSAAHRKVLALCVALFVPCLQGAIGKAASLHASKFSSCDCSCLFPSGALPLTMPDEGELEGYHPSLIPVGLPPISAPVTFPRGYWQHADRLGINTLACSSDMRGYLFRSHTMQQPHVSQCAQCCVQVRSVKLDSVSNRGHEF